MPPLPPPPAVPPAAAVLQLAVGTVHLATRRIHHPGGETHLTDLEAGLLAFLAARPGEVVPVDVLLREVWGHTRAVETRAVHNTVRRLRAKIEVDPAEPTHLHTVFGVGFRWEPGAAAPTAPPPAPSRPLAPPRPRDLFVGRGDALDQIDGAIARGVRIVSLVGSGGIGKTRLGLAWLDTRRDAATTGFCDLSGARTIADVRVSVARWLGNALVTDDVHVGRALDAVGPTVLLLDDIEPLAGDLQATLGRWLAEAEHLVLLLTSRIHLPIDGAFTLPVPPLPTPDPVDAPGGAGALFLDRARAAGARLRHDEPTLDHVRVLVGLVGGVPLALEMAAKRAGSIPLPALVASLAEPAAFGASDNDRSQALFAWSWGQLPEDTRARAPRLAIFVDGFGLAGLEAVLDRRGADALALVQTLVQHSILLPPDPETGRYRILPLLRAALHAELERDPDGLRTAGERFLAWAESVDPRPLDPLPEAAVLGARRGELLNLDAAVMLALAWGRRETAARIALILGRAYELVGPRSAEQRLLERLLADGDAGLQPLTRAALRLRLYSLNPNIGGPGGGAALDALAGSLPADAHVHHAQLHHLRAAHHLAHGRGEAALAEIRSSLHHAQSSGLPGLHLRTLAAMTRVRAVSGDLGAIAAGVEGLQLAAERGLLAAEVELALATSRACHVLGRRAEALAFVDQAVAGIARLEAEIGLPLPLLRLIALADRMTVLHARGDAAETTRAAMAVAPLAARLSDHTLLSESNQLLAFGALVAGDPAAGLRHALVAVRAVDPDGRPRLWWAANTWVGVARLLLGNTPGAIEVLGPCAARWPQLGEGIGDVAAAWLAVALASGGEPTAAVAWLGRMDAQAAGTEGLPPAERVAAHAVVACLTAGTPLHPALPAPARFSALAARLGAR